MSSDEFGLDFATLDNIQKARDGREFERLLMENILNPLKSKGIIDDYTHQPKYEQCFNPDFEVKKGNKIVIVDTTTTARTDRIKGKQWDAYQAKKVIKSRLSLLGEGKKEVKAFVVVRHTTGREKMHFQRAKKYIKRCSHESLEGILSIEEFAKILAEV